MSRDGCESLCDGWLSGMREHLVKKTKSNARSCWRDRFSRALVIISNIVTSREVGIEKREFVLVGDQPRARREGRFRG